MQVKGRPIGFVDVKVNLVATDAKAPSNVVLANKAKQLMLNSFRARKLQDISEVSEQALSREKLTLHVEIFRCTAGSRLGRCCCGELGVGWALLFFTWKVTDDRTKETMMGPLTEKFRNSGAIGADDICSATVGEDAVTEMARSMGPNVIERKVPRS